MPVIAANGPERRAPGVHSRSMTGSAARIAVHAFFWLYAAACLFPMLLVLIVSLSDEQSVIRNGYQFIPEQLDLSAYRYLLKEWVQILRSYGVTVFVTVTGTVLSVIVMALYAYPISRSDFPQRKFFSFFVFFTMLLNGGLVPWYIVYVNFLGLRNHIWALIMPLIVSAFFVLIIRTFFQTSVPREVLESATMDGAGEFRVFARIVLPLSMPVLATTALFSTLNYWNDWFLSLVFITDDKTVSIQYLMLKTLLNIQFLSTNPQAATSVGTNLRIPSETVRMAMAVVGIGPIVFAYPFFQKYFVKGLTVGAVKG